MKFWLILILAGFLNADDIRIRQAELTLDTLFSSEKSSTTCGFIEGVLDNSCYECYMCEDDRIKKYNTDVIKLKLTSADCATVSTVCCIDQHNIGTRSFESCGKKSDPFYNEDGSLQSRATVRSVLHGEYPWRVWIINKDNTGNGKLLCAGTVVDTKNGVVMTSANCLYGLTPEEVAVSFKSNYRNGVIDAGSIIIHPSYETNRKHVNDIALLVLSKRQRAPGWVDQACLPFSPPMPATTCITISENDFYVSTVVPTPKKCESFNIASALGQICAVAPLDDYVPHKGGALLCQDDQTQTKEIYYVAGIALSTTDSVTTYTAVHHYYDWIIDQIGKAARR